MFVSGCQTASKNAEPVPLNAAPSIRVVAEPGRLSQILTPRRAKELLGSVASKPAPGDGGGGSSAEPQPKMVPSTSTHCVSPGSAVPPGRRARLQRGILRPAVKIEAVAMSLWLADADAKIRSPGRHRGSGRSSGPLQPKRLLGGELPNPPKLMPSLKSGAVTVTDVPPKNGPGAGENAETIELQGRGRAGEP